MYSLACDGLRSGVFFLLLSFGLAVGVTRLVQTVTVGSD